jgi:hypothetical protein
MFHGARSAAALTRAVIATTMAFGAFTTASAAPILDGTGFGAPTAVITHDGTTAEGNFGTPGTTSDGAAYNIFVKGDSHYAYVLVQETGSFASSPGIFANLYFGTGASAASTSDVAFEVTNSDVFVPGGAGPFSTAGQDLGFAVLNAGSAIEFAVAWSYFETDPQGLGFTRTTAANPDVILRLSQSYGYSVAGGASFGPNRLGLLVDPIGAAATVPEPDSLALLALGLAAVVVRRRRAKG